MERLRSERSRLLIVLARRLCSEGDPRCIWKRGCLRRPASEPLAAVAWGASSRRLADGGIGAPCSSCFRAAPRDHEGCPDTAWLAHFRQDAASRLQRSAGGGFRQRPAHAARPCLLAYFAPNQPSVATSPDARGGMLPALTRARSVGPSSWNPAAHGASCSPRRSQRFRRAELGVRTYPRRWPFHDARLAARSLERHPWSRAVDTSSLVHSVFEQRRTA